MKRIVFVIGNMGIGGAQKSLIQALRNIDYSLYDVTLYVRRNKTELLSEVPSGVRVIVNKSASNISHGLVSRLYEIPKRVCKKIGLRLVAKKIADAQNCYYIKTQYSYEEQVLQTNEEYDIAISYMNGDTCRFVRDRIKANNYILFYLASVDAVPEIHRSYLPLYDSIVTDSTESKQVLLRNYPGLSEKITTINNYIDWSDIHKKAQEVLDFDRGNGYVFVSCGRLVDVKGHDLAIQAAQRLKEKKISFKWLFVGDGPRRKELEEMIISYGLQQEVIIIGMKKNPYPWIMACDIYVQPSYEESYGLTITEAAVLNKTIVATNTAGAREQLVNNETGIIVDINDRALADGIMNLINNSELKGKIENNLKNRDWDAAQSEYRKKIGCLLEHQEQS